MQLQKTGNLIMALKKEPKNMTGCLLNATETGDQQLVKTLLKNFSLETGATNYLNIMRVPSGERIPALAKTDRSYVHKIISAQIEYSMKFFNVSNSLTLEQIFLLADEIIDESESDNLSLQDVFVFLQKLCTGKMGKIFNRLDIPTFMEYLDIHRVERMKEKENYDYEMSAQHKYYDPERASDNQDRERELNAAAIGDYLRAKYKEK